MVATYPIERGYSLVKNILKIVLLVVVAVIAVKLLPLTFALGGVLALGLLGMLAVGVSALAILLVGMLALAAVLAPVWIPVLLILGLIALIKRAGKSTVAG